MKVSAVISEAWRNLGTGTTRGLLFSLISICVITGSCVLDMHGITAILAGQRDFRDAGATVQVVSGAGGISGSQCLALGEVAGISNAMAVRSSSAPLAVSVLPSTPPALFEASGAIFHFLPPRDPLNPRIRSDGGVNLSSSIAEKLGSSPGDMLAVQGIEVLVTDVFSWPIDGRASLLDGAAVVSVPPTGRFDECWVDVWPPDTRMRTLLLAATIPDPDTGRPATVTQLNPTLGPGKPTAELLALRDTRIIRWAAITVAFGLGFVSVFIRRIEVAFSVHSGARHRLVTIQMAFEAIAWSSIAALATFAAIVIIARQFAQAADVSAVIGVQMPTVFAAAAAIVLGAMTGSVCIRSKSLFRYAKDR